MVDFLMISTKCPKQGVVEIYPKFKIIKSSDLMIRGGDFYAIWIEDENRWSVDEHDALMLIDNELRKYAEENKNRFDGLMVRVLYMWDAESGMIDAWHKYCQKQLRDDYHILDESIIFANTVTSKKDYASKRLPYALSNGSYSSWDRLISVLYSPEERHKIEWSIGSIVTGDSKTIQKFMVFYGSAGTGKSTILNIIQKLFDGYCCTFDAKALGSTSNVFALEAFRSNPLVAIQHDGDLSKIEDNTRLNSLVSHETMTVNEKFKSTYANSFKCFLYMGTNKPVRITDAKSGLIRRLIDVTPSGNKISQNEYSSIMSNIQYELGAIAEHCKQVYLDSPNYYDNYIPVSMLGASNDFYNFVMDSYFEFSRQEYVTLKSAWEMYKTYCTDANVLYPMSQRSFKEELKNYFENFYERLRIDDVRIRNCYVGFLQNKFEQEDDKDIKKNMYKIELNGTHSKFDEEFSDQTAQYANLDNEAPLKKWDNVNTKLCDLDTTKLHYTKVPTNHIVIDFDLVDENGEKNLEKNLKEASKWPPTYTELSKSGKAVHLHYNYDGDVSQLSHVYDDHIEIKTFNGNASLRRKLTRFNNLDISTISSGLPLKGVKKMVSDTLIKNEKMLRIMIKKNLNKEIHPNTKPSIDFIYKLLEDAYSSDMIYDVTDMKGQIFTFAASSSNQAEYCMKLVKEMKFKSENDMDNIVGDSKLIFFDIEIFPNLFIVNWKAEGENKSVVRMINPTPSDIENLIKYNLVGFNCRHYDNHILYAALMGYNNEQLFKLSQRIIEGDKNACFGNAYNISYTDVYDFASAGNKKSLKKWEVELGIKHHELGLPWDEPVPEDKWEIVAEYCDHDVLATEAVFNHLSADFTARKILASIAGMTPNDTTNTLTTNIIFGKNKHPQDEFNYRDLSKPVFDLSQDVRDFLFEACPKMMSQTHGEEGSLLPYFPGYKYENGKSTYLEEEVGEGGYVYAEPGIYCNVALLDVASMHPHSTIAECLFGLKYTKAYMEIVEGRVDIKHESWDKVDDILGGALKPYIDQVKNGEMTSKDLANALKTAINSVYGLTMAKFENPFRDNRNIDNIVAKRGSLFMITLKKEVQKRGFTVAHIKTDSIKIPNATPEIIDFVMNFGEMYGYTFEHEATYEKMCLVNDAVYIAKYLDSDTAESMYNYIPGDNIKKGGKWTATGAQFQVPYVFKTLFSKEPIEFNDLCEVKSVTSAIYLDLNESLPDVTKYEKELAKLETEYKKNKINEFEYLTNKGDLQQKINKGHKYKFIGKTGEFCPVKEGTGGGLLVRENNTGKYTYVTGTKGYRWKESEMLIALDKKDCVDIEYFNKMVDDAIESIKKYCDNYDFEWFIS